MIYRVLIIASLFSAGCLSSYGQAADSLLTQVELDELDSMLSFSDSLSIFRMIDSLMQMPAIEDHSQMAVRIGYNSNIASTGRNLGISQFGLAPGISYYHKSGAYGDVSGYWSNQFDPSYYLTIMSAGYIGVILPKWSVLGEYSHYFYSQRDDSLSFPYTNSLGVSNFADWKKLTFRLDYSYLFGKEGAHRVLPGIMLNLEKKNWHKIRRIILYPSFNVMFGSNKVGSGKYAIYPDYLLRFKLNRDRPPGDKLPYTYEIEENKFGVMNYSFSAPLSVSIKDWNFLLSYTYNIPKALPGEVLGLTKSGYLSASITRYISFK